MRGTWLAAIARHITRTETFESLVSPALADLQYESAARRPIGRHYAAVVIVLATALLRDLKTDVHLTFTTARVWQRTASWGAGFGAFYVATVLYVDTPWHLLDSVGRATAVAYAVAVGVWNALPYALAAAVFYLRRQHTTSRRTVAAAALTFVAAAATFNLTLSVVRPETNRIMVDSVAKVVAEGRPGATLDDRARYPGHWQDWLESRRERSDNPPHELGRSIGGGAVFSAVLILLPWMMFGLVLARGRRWTVFFRVLGIFATYAFVQMFIIQLQVPMLTGLGRSSDAVRQVFAMFLTGTLWLVGVRLLLGAFVPIYALTGVKIVVTRRRSSH